MLNTTLTRIEWEANNLYETEINEFFWRQSLSAQRMGYIRGAKVEATRAYPLLKALEEARETIQWMIENLKTDNPQDQHDRSMNAIENINQVTGTYKNDKG